VFTVKKIKVLVSSWESAAWFPIDGVQKMTGRRLPEPRKSICYSSERKNIASLCRGSKKSLQWACTFL
jgi:hypothetical protein